MVVGEKEKSFDKFDALPFLTEVIAGPMIMPSMAFNVVIAIGVNSDSFVGIDRGGEGEESWLEKEKPKQNE